MGKNRKYLFQQFLMVAGEDDVVIANWVGQEIRGLCRVCQLDDLLRSAEVGLRLVTNQPAFCDEVAREVAGDFEDGDVFLFHIAPDAHAYARLKVGVVLKALHHIERNGAVGKDHLARLWVDAGGVGLETADTDERLGDGHRE